MKASPKTKYITTKSIRHEREVERHRKVLLHRNAPSLAQRCLQHGWTWMWWNRCVGKPNSAWKSMKARVATQ